MAGSTTAPPGQAISARVPPTPNTNRRILYDLEVNAQLPSSRVKSFETALVAAETMKDKSLISAGAAVLPDGIKLFNGKQPLKLDQLDKKVVQSAVKNLVEKELNDEQKAKVEASGILAASKPKAPRGSGNKRSHTETASTINPDDIEIDEDAPIDWDCDQIRRKINSFLESGEMKVTEFLKKLEVNSNSYGRFMKLKGPLGGSSNSTYYAAAAFFKKRELAGVKIQKKRKTASSKSSASIDLSDIHLDGEDTDSVEVYDSCDEIRRKISAHLRKEGVTQAAFLRDIAAQFHTTDVKLQSKQLNDFRQKKGADAGNTSRIFYGAYVYFEKLRLKEGKPKSKHRQEMEKIWGSEGGFDTKTASYRQGDAVTVKTSIPSQPHKKRN